MKTLTQEKKETASHLKARLWLSVAKIVEEEVNYLSQQGSQINTTPNFIATLVELTYNQLLTLGEDLESFARHAKRKTITPDDLFMCVRRNEELGRILRDYFEILNSGDTKEESITEH